VNNRRRADASPLKAIAVLLATILLAGGAPGSSVGEEVKRQSPASQAGAEAAREAKALPATRLVERASFLDTGEAALARLDTAAALNAFERAAQILHAADTEIALVRSHMQAGDYRRALAFGAHTAGAHLDVAGGPLLYAWLLHLGGQPAIARRVLIDTEARNPSDRLVRAVQAQLGSGAPRATDGLLTPPLRLAPYAEAKGLPPSARVAGSAVLLPDGITAVVPLSLLPRSGRLWLRNGLGRLARASVEKRLTAIGVALVRLERTLPLANELSLAAGNAFPGSAVFAVEYVGASNAEAAWPVLRTGFLGSASGDSGERLLGIDMPAGTRGGPVFDAAGQLIGLALPGRAGKGGERLLAASQLREALGPALAGAPLAARDAAQPPVARPREGVDKIYEASLRSALQVITAP